MCNLYFLKCIFTILYIFTVLYCNVFKILGKLFVYSMIKGQMSFDIILHTILELQ